MKTKLLLVAVGSIFVLSGCGHSNQAFFDGVTKQLQALGNVETQYNSDMAASRAGTKTDQQIHQDIQTWIPQLDDMVSQLQSLEKQAPSKFAKPVSTLQSSAKDFETCVKAVDDYIASGDTSQSDVSTVQSSLNKSNSEYEEFKTEWTSAGGTITNTTSGS